MSRCACCNHQIEFEYNLSPDLCAKCSEIIRRSSRDDGVIPRERVHEDVCSGLTAPKKNYDYS